MKLNPPNAHRSQFAKRDKREMCSFGSCQTRFEFLSQFRKVWNELECFVTQVQTLLPKTKRVWPMKINVICTKSLYKFNLIQYAVLHVLVHVDFVCVCYFIAILTCYRNASDLWSYQTQCSLPTFQVIHTCIWYLVAFLGKPKYMYIKIHIFSHLLYIGSLVLLIGLHCSNIVL